MALPLLPPSEIAPVVGLVLVASGLILGLVGRALLKTLMALVGAALGGALGFLLGEAIVEVPVRVAFLRDADLGVALVMAVVGAVVGALLLGLLAKTGVAFLLAAVGAAAAAGLLGSNVVGVLLFVPIFAVAFYFIDEVLGIAMALLGGLLVTSGAFILLDQAPAALGVGGLVALVGGLVQTLALHPPGPMGIRTLPR